jgi:hypothetical protein
VEHFMSKPHRALYLPMMGLAAGLNLVAALVGPVAAAEQGGDFDGVYTGSIAVTSVRAVPCAGKDFTPSITIADGIVSLIYLPSGADAGIVLTAAVSRGGLFAGEGKGKFTISVAGTVSRDRIIAKTWAWNCEYALTMQKTAKPSLVVAAASAPGTSAD